MPLIRTLSAAVAVTAVLLSAGCGDSADSLLTKAKESIAKNDSKAAEIHLKNLLQKEDRAEARYLLGQVHANVGDWRAAEKEFRLAHSGGYEREKSLYALAHALLQAGEVKKALEEASKLAPTTDEQRADAQALMGRIHLAMGKREDAAKAYEKALAVAPNHLNAGLGAIMLRAGTDLPGATQALDKLLANHPDSGDAQQLKGEFLLAAGQRDKALELFKKVAAANPNNRQVRVQIASLVSDDKQYAEAQKWIDELKKLTGPAPMTMYLQALNDLRQGKHEAARDAALQALKVAPEFLQAASVAASAQLALNAFEQAEKHAKLIVEKAPNSTLGYRLLGATYLKMNAPEKALQAVSLPVEKGAKDGSLYAIAGEAALRMNEPAKALGYFKQATTLDPKDPARKTGMAIAMLASGDRERGMLELERLATENETGSQADLALISQLLGERKWDEALKAIDRLEKKQPKAPLVANLRGLTLQGKGDAAGARAAFEAALALDPTFFAAVSNLAALDLQAKKPDDAKKRFTTLLDKQPKNINAMLALARISQGQGKTEEKEMLGWLKKAWETDRSSIAASLALSGYYLGSNQAKEAVPVLQEAATAHPERIELLDALGTAYLRAGDDAQAIATFDRLLRVRPDSAPLQTRMGQFYVQRREFERAMPFFKKAIELAPKALEPRAGLASALVGAGKAQEARAIATAIQAEAPKSPVGATLEGDILAAGKNWNEAIAAYRKALSIQKTAAISMKLDQVLRVSGREPEANALLKSLIAEAPNDPTVRNYAGMIDIANKRWPEAIAHYKVVLDRSPNHALALNNMAWAQMEMNDPSALGYAERAVAASPVSPEVLDTYGAVLLRQGNAGRAADVMKQAVDLSPKVPGYRLRYAEALIQRGDKADARKQIDILLGDVKSGPYFEQAQQLMKRL